MKDHEVRELIDTLTAIAKEYGETQQLRSRISEAVLPTINALMSHINDLDELVVDTIKMQAQLDLAMRTAVEAEMIYEEVRIQLGAEKGGVINAISVMKDELKKFHNIMDAHPEFMLFVHAESKSQIRRLVAQSKKDHE